MKQKVVPVIIAIALIIIIGGGSLGISLYDRYFSYTKEEADKEEYFGLASSGQVAVIVDNEILENKAILREGHVYFDIQSLRELINSRFYHDYNESLLIYTTPNEIITNPVGTMDYYINGEGKSFDFPISLQLEDKLYVALDYAGEYTNIAYEFYDNPQRIVITTKGGEKKISRVKKNSAVRLTGGIKGELLTDVEKGDELVVLEELEDWSRVFSPDGYIGYIEKKHITEPEDVIVEAPAEYIEPEYTRIQEEGKFSLAFHAIYGKGGNDTLVDYVKNTGIDIICPTWFRLNDNDGHFDDYSDKGYVDTARNMGIKVWAVVDNVENPVETLQILSYTSKRTALINSLMERAEALGLSGLNMDFEVLTSETIPHYVEFLRELSVACRSKGITLSVDNYSPIAGTNFGLREQGIVADYVLLMGYDEHWSSGGVAGSVASIGFVEEGIKLMIEAGVPAQKLINAVPFYTRIWKTEGDTVRADTLGMDRTMEFIEKNNVPVSWDPVTAQNYGEKQLGATLYQVWIEDEDSIRAKLDVARSYGLPAVGAWALGYENKGVWSVIEEFCRE